MKNIQLQFNDHQNELQNFAMGFTRDLEDANDLVQDTFLKAIRYSQLYEEGTNLRAWFTLLCGIHL